MDKYVLKEQHKTPGPNIKENRNLDPPVRNEQKDLDEGSHEDEKRGWSDEESEWPDVVGHTTHHNHLPPGHMN